MQEAVAASAALQAELDALQELQHKSAEVIPCAWDDDPVCTVTLAARSFTSGSNQHGMTAHAGG